MKPIIQRTPCPTCNGAGIQYRVSGGWARKQREATGLSLREVARRMEFSAPYLCDLELGHRPMSQELWEQYRMALEAPKKGRKA